MFATRATSKQQFLPDLVDQASNNENHQRRTQIKSQEGGCPPTRTTSNSSTINLELLPRLQTLSNSALVHQRASAASSSSTVGDHLAVASVQTGASVPLMIGNRPKCVLNLLDEQQQQQLAHHQNHCGSIPTHSAPPASGPQNTALRAEQRRQNMSISVVRPVVVVNGTSSAQTDGSVSSKLSSSSSSSSALSLIDEWMSFDRAHPNAAHRGGAAVLDELLLSIKAADFDHNLGSSGHELKTDQERQRTLAWTRREQQELQRSIGRQHQFMMDKLEERKRYLSIVQSVWVQRDFKHAIEKLVDIYHQGLIFAPNANDQQQGCKLKSLNTSLAVDVISIIILRPKLWTLEICQLLLPIINQDLLLQNQYEYYTEIGLKALKLILAHFSSIITSTLESLKEASKLVGVDLSREDRINKCLACYKLLLESHSVMRQQQQQQQQQHFHHKQRPSATGDGQQCKLAAFQRELQAMFNSLFNSIQLDSSVLAKRFCG